MAWSVNIWWARIRVSWKIDSSGTFYTSVVSAGENQSIINGRKIVYIDVILLAYTFKHNLSLSLSLSHSHTMNSQLIHICRHSYRIENKNRNKGREAIPSSPHIQFSQSAWFVLIGISIIMTLGKAIEGNNNWLSRFFLPTIFHCSPAVVLTSPSPHAKVVECFIFRVRSHFVNKWSVLFLAICRIARDWLFDRMSFSKVRGLCVAEINGENFDYEGWLFTE